ncbi:hypothetical protein E1B28_004522 [Marasmius oreades]|uniref:Major facilitator superfamily (MFS) profile domain-containing protein n=1 Tax=Marasmius oreades TaxID=181124 RepID=A0A9P7UYR7_9AGAR|nr:uncharacterized protein E1B28_004522 [Marasmius oreades]KAG7097144.1 hypothetical protein E1B28_004522 [Marasmius oreades]
MTPERRPLLGASSDLSRTTYHSERSSLSEHSTVVPDQDDLLNTFTRAQSCCILAGLWSAVFLGALDGTVVATLLAPIGSDFKKSNQASYIGTSYLLSVCCFTPLYGRLSDVMGRKGAMLLALSLFGSGTILCGLAPSMEALIAARALAGMGGGGVMTVSSIVVTDFIPLNQRGLYQGMANILFGLGAGIGGPLGGWINDKFGWKSAFFFQAPVLLFSFTLVAWKVNIKLPSEVQNLPLSEKFRRIDFLGSITLVGTVGSLLLGFSLKTTEELPWSHPIVYGLFTATFVFAALFVFTETRLAPYPVMPLRLICRRTPLAVAMSNLFGSMAAFSVLYNIPLYFSAVHLYSSADSGLHLLPHSVAISTGSVFAGWVMRRTGKLYTLNLFSALSALVATALLVFWNRSTPTFHLWFDIVPQGFGMASVITCTLIAMIAGVEKHDMAVATGITYLFRTTGQVLGVSLSGATLQAVLLQKLRQRIQGPGAMELIYEIQHSTSIIPTLPPDLKEAAISSYADALRVVFICQAAWNFLAFLCCIPIQESLLPGSPHHAQNNED